MKTNDEQDGPTVKLKVQDEHNKLNNNTTKYQTILLNKKMKIEDHTEKNMTEIFFHEDAYQTK